jgi:phosphatidylglycerophosphate synthase
LWTCVKCSRAICCFSRKFLISYFALFIRNWKIRILRSFAKLQKWMFEFPYLTIRLPFFLSILPFARPMEPGTRWTDLRDNLYWKWFLVNYVQKIDTFLKSDRINKQFIWRSKYIHDYLVANVNDL